jgi:hypothetical protein
MKKTILILAALLFESAHGHGTILVAECYKGKGEILVRAEASEGSLDLVVFADGNKKDSVLKSAKTEIEDKVKEGKVVERIQITSGKSSLLLNIPEIYAHKIRRGQGVWKPGSSKVIQLSQCYLVYDQ